MVYLNGFIASNFKVDCYKFFFTILEYFHQWYYFIDILDKLFKSDD